MNCLSTNDRDDQLLLSVISTQFPCMWKCRDYLEIGFGVTQILDAKMQQSYKIYRDHLEKSFGHGNLIQILTL